MHAGSRDAPPSPRRPDLLTAARRRDPAPHRHPRKRQTQSVCRAASMPRLRARAPQICCSNPAGGIIRHDRHSPLTVNCRRRPRGPSPRHSCCPWHCSRNLQQLEYPAMTPIQAASPSRWRWAGTTSSPRLDQQRPDRRLCAADAVQLGRPRASRCGRWCCAPRAWLADR